MTGCMAIVIHLTAALSTFSSNRPPPTAAHGVSRRRTATISAVSAPPNTQWHYLMSLADATRQKESRTNAELVWRVFQIHFFIPWMICLPFSSSFSQLETSVPVQNVSRCAAQTGVLSHHERCLQSAEKGHKAVSMWWVLYAKSQSSTAHNTVTKKKRR